ncbi:MAG: cytochrome [Polaromonas sp.]|nr:cytochrome [Polaromonas sp.]
MSRCDALANAALWAASLALAMPVAVHAQDAKPLHQAMAGIGRTATPGEVKAWDIDVRPDFKGLPRGRGSVNQGEVIWDAQCASCHGSFGESSDVFTPLAGGITAQDLKTGRVDGLMPGSNQPQRTTLMKVSTLSTLWDYIHRAMPWNAPKTLSADDVYAVTAYILNLNNVLPADFVLSDANVREVQARLPNRHGVTTGHAMWPGKELGGSARPDVQGSPCMRDCQADVVVKSFLPDYARNAHGNLAEQSRRLGPVRGIDTTRPAPVAGQGQAVKTAAAPVLVAQAAPETIASQTSATPSAATAGVLPVLQKNACLACHGMDTRLVGPAFRDISTKYRGRPDAQAYLSGKIRSGGQGVWGAIPMPAQSLSADESAQLARWLVQGAGQ